MPTVAATADLVAIARACGYPYAASVSTFDSLDAELRLARQRAALTFLEIKCAIGAREDLGRPTTTAKENKENFMEQLGEAASLKRSASPGPPPEERNVEEILGERPLL